MRNIRKFVWLICLSSITQTVSAQYLGGGGDGHSADGGTFSLGCTIPAAERAALVELFNATNGPSWTDNTNWNTTADPSLWYGVVVDGCHVIELHLDGNNLDGNIPEAIGDLGQLRQLSLSYNLIYTIPDDLNSLNEITHLDISNNQIYSELPPDWENLVLLRELRLNNNHFEGSIPPGLGDLINLRILDLGDNQLSGTIPPELGNLTRLIELYLDHNHLSGEVPGALGPLGSFDLGVADFSNNQLTGMVVFNAEVMDLDISNNMLDFEDIEPILDQLPTGVNYSPQADLPPGGVITFTVGGTLTIPFSAGGTMNEYVWYQNNTDLASGSPTYVKTDATANDAGVYRLRIENSLAPALVLQTEPYIVIQDGCSGVPRSSGTVDLSFNAGVGDADQGGNIYLQGTNILAVLGNNVVDGTPVDGVLRYQPDGTLDPSFNIGSVSPGREALVVLPDNSILIGESSGTYGYISKWDADGNLDPSLNSTLHQWYSGTIRSMAVQSDGRIVACHNAYNTNDYIDRIMPDGSPDGSFIQLPDFHATVIRVRPDDMMLAGGYYITATGEYDPAIHLLDVNGEVNDEFLGFMSDDGGRIYDMAIQPDGKIIVVGSFRTFNDDHALGIARLTSNGETDFTFQAMGITQVFSPDAMINNVELQPDGKIVISGRFESINGSQRISVARLNSDGSLDCSFDPAIGPQPADPADPARLVTGIAIQPDKKILLSGNFVSFDGEARTAIVRLSGEPVAGIIISLQPVNETVCNDEAVTFTTAATGAANITYRWQFSPDGITPFADISEATDATLTSDQLAAGFYRCRIEGDGVTPVTTNVVTLTVNTVTVPTGTGASLCGPGVVTLTASGATDGQYRWYTTSTGGSPNAGEVNGVFTTPSLSTTTIYYAAILIGGCESPRTAITATINSLPAAPGATGGFSCVAAPILLQASGGSDGSYRWYTTASGGTAISGEVNSIYTTPSIATTTTYYVTLHNGTCESNPRVAATATIGSGGPPPTVTHGGRCDPGPVSLTASGGSDGEYRWYDVATGGSPLAGEVNGTYTTPSISVTTTYYVTIHNGSCETSPRTAVTATVGAGGPGPAVVGATRCGPGAVTLSASGGTDGQYRWYDVATGGTSLAGETNATFTTPSITSTQTWYVSIDTGCESERIAVTATVATVPGAPLTTAGARCAPGTVTLSASGSADGNYRWYTASSGGTAITGEVNATYTTPSIATTTSYFVSVHDGVCESARTEVIATVNTVPGFPVTTGASALAPASVTLTAAGALPGQYRWYTTPTGGTAIPAQVNATYVTPVLSVSTTYYVAIHDGNCEGARAPVLALMIANQAPVIQPPTAQASVGGSVTLSLTAFISDPDNNLDLTTLEVTGQPLSGAGASIDPQYNLVLDYSGIRFTGTDRMTIGVCDLLGACTTQEVQVEVVGDLFVFNAISPNGDDKNPILYIQHIDLLPETRNNKVSVFNRWGDQVFETTDYDNVSRVFDGMGRNGEPLPTGTYYYKIDFANGAPSKTGYIQINH